MPPCNQCKHLYYVSSDRSERRLPHPYPGSFPLCCLRHSMKVALCFLAQIWPTSAVLVRRWWWRPTCSETAGGYTARHTLFFPHTTVPHTFLLFHIQSMHSYLYRQEFVVFLCIVDGRCLPFRVLYWCNKSYWSGIPRSPKELRINLPDISHLISPHWCRLCSLRWDHDQHNSSGSLVQ